MKKERLHRAAEDLRLEKSWDTDGITVLRALVTLPQFEGRRERRLNRYYRRFGAAFLKYCEQELYPRAAALCREKMAVSAPWTLSRATLSYTVSYDDGALLSLVFDALEENLPPQLCIRRADTWDLKCALPVPLAEFFPDKEPWRKTVRHALLSLARERSGLFPDYRRALRLYFNPRNYCLSAEGIRIFYQMQTLAPASEGIVEFLLPREKKE